MNKLFIPYKLALLAKEKGFKEKTLAAYDRIHMLCTHSTDIFKPLNYNTGGNYTSAPTYQELLDWFRDNHKIEIKTFPHAWHEKIYYDYYLLIDMIPEASIAQTDPNAYYRMIGTNNEALDKGIEEAFRFCIDVKENV